MCDSAFERRAKLRRVADRALSGHAVGRRHFRVVDKRVTQRGADVCAVGAAPTDTGHELDEHEFLMPRTVVVHDREQRQAVMCCRPERARRVVDVAITLDVDDKTAARPGGERGARACADAVADPGRTLAAEVAVGPVVRPEVDMMCTGECARGGETPVFVLDQRPQLRVDPRGTDRARMPADTLFGDRSRDCGEARLCVCACVARSPVIGGPLRRACVPLAHGIYDGR